MGGVYHGRAVQRGQLAAALDLDARVVDAAALQRRQQRLHGMHAARMRTQSAVNRVPSKALQCNSCVHAHSQP